jgi:hypothetical protein
MFTLYLVVALLIVEAVALAIFLLPVPRIVLQAMINIHSKLKVPLRFLFATLGYFVFGKKTRSLQKKNFYNS